MAQILSGAPAAEALTAGLTVRSRALRERGILIRYLGGALADRVRITIGTPGQMDALLEATDEILKRS